MNQYTVTTSLAHKPEEKWVLWQMGSLWHTSLTGFADFGMCLSPDLWAPALDNLELGLDDDAEAFLDAFSSPYTAGHLELTDTCTCHIILSWIRQKILVLAPGNNWVVVHHNTPLGHGWVLITIGYDSQCTTFLDRKFTILWTRTTRTTSSLIT
jgi:hypothetical protein